MGWLGCSLAGNHDLWLDVTAEQDSHVEVHLPANWILDHEEAVSIDTPDGRIDLREEAKRLRSTPGVGSRTWTPDPGVTVTLREQRRSTGETATSVRIGTRGPKGFGLGLTVPLNADEESRCAKALGQHIEVEEVDVQFGPEFCSQLANSAPTTLVKVSGGFLGGVTIETE